MRYHGGLRLHAPIGGTYQEGMERNDCPKALILVESGRQASGEEFDIGGCQQLPPKRAPIEGSSRAHFAATISGF
jgi:hypothetical protein